MTKSTTDNGSATAKPHAVLMDRVYRRQRHIYDLTRKYYLLGRDRLVRELNPRPGEQIVEIGCGTARNLIRIAETYPHAELFGLDASQAMLTTAAEAVARAKFQDRIVLKHALADELCPALFGVDGPFDHVIFSYSLSMIPDWRGALAASARAVKPGGTIHIVDFGDLKSLWRPASKGLRAWLKLFHVAPRDELLSAVEASGSKQSSSRLSILPGRYAFIFHATPETIAALAGR